MVSATAGRGLFDGIAEPAPHINNRGKKFVGFMLPQEVSAERRPEIPILRLGLRRSYNS